MKLCFYMLIILALSFSCDDESPKHNAVSQQSNPFDFDKLSDQDLYYFLSGEGMYEWQLVSKSSTKDGEIPLTDFSKTITIKLYREGRFIVESHLQDAKIMAEGQWDVQEKHLVKSYNSKLEKLMIIGITDTSFRVSYPNNIGTIIDTYAIR